MGVVDDLNLSREAFGRGDWVTAFNRLEAISATGELEPADLERWGTAAFLLGRPDASVEALQEAHRSYLSRGDVSAATRSAFWVGLTCFLSGEGAVGAGWIKRAWRLAAALEDDCLESGYLLIPRTLELEAGGDFAAAEEVAAQAERIARLHHDADLTALALHQRARAQIYLGLVSDGVAGLDEAMAGVVAGEVNPIFAGVIYCSTIEACQEIADFQRARQWTSALTRWCDDQPGLVPYTGQCAVHRGQLMRLDGAFAAALEELRLACRRYHDSGSPQAAGLALYESGEVHRLRGDFEAAAKAFEEASGWGYEPQPGLASLWMMQGRAESAAHAIHRVLGEARTDVRHIQVLPAAVEILLACGDLAAAERAVEFLAELADRFGGQALEARALLAKGTVLLAAGAPAEALPHLRGAWHRWTELAAPYEAAAARTGLGRAFRALDDEESARLELTAAAQELRELGALPALREVESLLGPSLPDGLTAREVEVLRLVSRGLSNARIAEELVISQKTVARHLSNIFTKIGVTSRTAAATYALEQRLT